MKLDELEIAVQKYCKHLQDNFDKRGFSSGKKYYYEFGRKYIHIISESNQRSSHSWVMMSDDKKFKAGDILKSASWNAPARNFARGNVFTGEFSHISCYGV
jgi:hypothetical protein